MSSAADDLVRKSIIDDLLKAGPKEAAAHAAAAVGLVPAVEEKPIELKPGQILASSFLKLPAKVKDFAIACLNQDEIPDAIKALVPTVDARFRPPVDAALALLRAWEGNDTALITGPTGCGKSELVKFLCAKTNRPFIRINMTEDIDSSSVFGTMAASGGSTYWIDGPAAEAVKFGGVLNVDEYDVTPPGIAMGFQWLLENGGKLFLKEMPGTAAEKTIIPDKDFRVVFNGNTLGQGDDTGSFAGTQVQNTAMIDRIRSTLKMDYMDSKEEIAMIKGTVPGIPEETMRKMVQFAASCRTAYKQQSIGLTVSPRTLINWGEKMLIWGDAKLALELAYLNKLRDSDRKVVNEFLQKSFGAAI